MRKGVPSEAGRSIKSEYDYGSKRKFVDVLGNFNKKNTLTIEKLDQEITQKDKMSSRSKAYSNASHLQRRTKTGVDRDYGSPLLPKIDEDDEIMLMNKNGERIDLNEE
jgi:hypothetical protein